MIGATDNDVMLTNQLFEELRLKKSKREEELQAWKLYKKKRVIERRIFRKTLGLTNALCNIRCEIPFPEFDDVNAVIDKLIPEILCTEDLVVKTANDIIDSINNNDLMTKDRLDSFCERDSIEFGDDSYCDSCNDGYCWCDI
jgi:hypothetical protein